MPSLNFNKKFVQLIKSGAKKQTIRKRRKNKRDPAPGRTLYFFTGMMSKQCERIGEAICSDVSLITVTQDSIQVCNRTLSVKDRLKLAKNDGFECAKDLIEFIATVYGLPFNGLIIKWNKIEMGKKRG